MSMLGTQHIASSMWKKIGVFWLVLAVLFWAMISLYLGANYQTSNNTGRLDIYVVDFDQGLVGQSFLNTTSTRIKTRKYSNSSFMPNDGLAMMGTLETSWKVFSPVNFEYSPELVRKAVSNGDVWGAIIVNPGASASLTEAAFNADPNYDPRLAITLIYDEGRDSSAVSRFVAPPMRLLVQAFQNEFSRNWTQSSANFSIVNIAQRAPHILTNPASWNEINLASASASQVVVPALSIGLILVLIFTFAAVTVSTNELLTCRLLLM
jgi:hypothetical protein